MEQRYIRVSAASKRTGLAKGTLYYYIRTGRLKATKISEKVTVIDIKELDKLMRGES